MVTYIIYCFTFLYIPVVVNKALYTKISDIKYGMIFACSLIKLFQLGGWYLNADHREIGYNYKTNNYNLMQTLNFRTTI